MTSDEMFELRAELKGEAKRVGNETRKIGEMHLRHGRTPGARCGECASFDRQQLGRVYRKCLRFGVTAGPGTDWLARWTACGAFEVAKPRRTWTLERAEDGTVVRMTLG